MKKILRSVIDADGQIPQDTLLKNYIYLSSSTLALANEEDREIWNFVQNYAVNYSAIPTKETIYDFLERSGEMSSVDRLEEITSVRKTYKNSDFENLVDEEVKNQKDQEMHVILKTSAQILFDGLSIKEGRDTVDYQGHRGAMKYIMKNADHMMASDRGFKTKSNIVMDTDEAREEFDRVCAGKRRNWGIITGLADIDRVCRGIKPGEMWTHAAFTGELKCLSGNSLVFNHITKKLERTEDLYDRGELPVVTALKHEGAEPLLVTAPTSHLVQNGVRPVYKVTLKSGRELPITDNHPLWTSKGGGTWGELKDVEVGDYVGVPSVMRVPEPRKDFSDAEVKAIGYLLGDGSIKDYMRLTAQNDEIRGDFMGALRDLGYLEGKADYETPNFLERFPEDRAAYVTVSHSVGNGNTTMASPLRMRLEELGLWGTDSNSKHIPGELFGIPERQVALLLGALWSTDGSCHTEDHDRSDRESKSKRNDITYGTKSKELATGIQGLLTRLGIQSTVRKVDTTYKDKPYYFYTVRVVTTPSKRRFCDSIRVVGKEDRFEELRGRLRGVDDRVFPTDLIDHLDDLTRTKSHTGSWRYAGQAKKRPTISGDGLRIFSQVDPELEKHIGGDVAWDQVESIEYIGEEMTYDLSVPTHHSFVVNDIITHNTTFALNWAYKAVFLQQYNVYYLSLEMPLDQLRRILYVMHSKHPKFQGKGWPDITYRLIRDGEDKEGIPINDAQKKFFRHIIDDIEENRGKNYGALIVRSPDEDVTVPRLKADLEITHQQTPIHMCVVDHFALMRPETSTRNYYTDLNSIVRDTKRLALTFNNGERIPMLGLLQINRDGKREAEKADGVYKMQALADSNEAERSSDVITTTYLDPSRRVTGSVKFGCLKNRDNPHFNPFEANIEWGTKHINNVVSHLNDNDALNAETAAQLIPDD